MPAIDHGKTDVLTPRLPPNEAAVDFFRNLRLSRLLAESVVCSLEANSIGSEISALCDRLTAEGLLTAYQLDRIREGSPTGLVLGSYKILEELGRGGVGEVYKAKHCVMDRVVALKVTTPGNHREKTAREQFRREIAAITRLNHPNVALTYDANEIDGVLYLAMEYVAGPTLQQVIAEEGALPIPMACSVLLQTARALQHAHERGLVHRDIKPGNMMLPCLARDRELATDPTILVKLVDFGLARLYPRGERQHSTLLCKTGSTMGTPAFISPEQIRNLHTVDIRSDIYSLGCTFYFALTGHLPFEGITTQATLALHLEREARPIQSWKSEIPFGLAAIVRRMMAKNPADRYQTPADLLEDLGQLILSGELCEAGVENRPTPVRRDAPHPHPPHENQTTPLALSLPSDELLLADTSPPADHKTDPLRLRSLACTWFANVERAVQGTPAELRDDEYKTLYRVLLEAIRTAHVTSQEPTKACLAQLHGLIEPWVSLRALDNLDDRTRIGLWKSCQSLEAKLWPRKLETPSPWLLPMCVFLSIGIAMVAGVCLAVDGARARSVVAELASAQKSLAALLLIPAILLLMIGVGRHTRAS